MTQHHDDLPDGTAAAATLLDQNVIQVGTQVLLVGGSGAGGPERYFVASAVGAVLPLVAALRLAWGPARSAPVGWSTHLARAAGVVALVGVAGAALMLLGGLLSGLTSGSGLIPM